MKPRRHFAIMSILSSKHITTQEELCEALKNQGYDVTQATVSRDIRELQLIKVSDENGYRYALPETQSPRISRERLQRLFQDSVVTIDYSENLIVIKTIPGAAQAVASAVDSSYQRNIMGTVAGDDTIFIAVKPKSAVAKVVGIFEDLLKL